MRADAVQDHAVVVLSREGVDVREQHAEVRPEALHDVELAGRGEAGEAADQRVHAVEHVLLLHAEQLLVGEIERQAFDEFLDFGGAERGDVDGALRVEAVVLGVLFESLEVRREDEGRSHLSPRRRRRN